MIVIQDDMLRDVIARTLHISEEEITEEKLLELKGLSARYAGITSLEGLQHAENLEYLDLCGNSIEILDPIRDLRNIRLISKGCRLVKSDLPAITKQNFNPMMAGIPCDGGTFRLW